MYTLYACIIINKTLKINPQNTYVKTFDTGLGGTSAKLLPEEYLSLMDLYHGLMLPSGNDAARVLACYYGSWLITSPFKTTFLNQRKFTLGDRSKRELFEKKFIQFMNQGVVRD